MGFLVVKAATYRKCGLHDKALKYNSFYISPQGLRLEWRAGLTGKEAKRICGWGVGGKF
ncbi:MAG TPA: hypothetical protein VL133_10390 [Devosia sp.]|nr:hypothetical protein [Devosia sp.]